MQELAKSKIEFEVESAAVSDRGLNESRPENEDSYLDLPECGIFAVADGVGGAQAGEVASQMAVEILSEAFTNMTETADPEGVMQAAISKANEAIFEMSSQLPQLAKMATTVVAMHIRGDVATIGHVGDSRLYRVGPDGNIAQETMDHSIVAEEVRAGRMSEDEAAVHPSRNIISRALGAEPSVEVDLKTLMVEKGTSFLLCTDGITRHVSNDEITQAIRGGDEPASVCGRLKDLCFERGAEDNLTAVLVRIGQNGTHFNTTQVKYLHEDEDEDTVATARENKDEPVFAEEADGVTSARFEIVDDGSETIEFGPDEPELTETTEVTAEEEAGLISSPDLSMGGQRKKPTAYSPPAGTQMRAGSLRLVLASVGFFLLGAAIGLGSYYYWTQSNPPVAVVAPSINEMKTTDIPLTAFEESRRWVDRDPRKFIAANQNPQEAADYFLLGRAYLLTGEYFLARNAFNTAKSRISEIDARDRQTIGNDIDMALSIISSGPATENFSKAVSNSSGIAATNPNSGGIVPNR